MAFTKRNKAAVKALVSCHETGKPVANYSAIVVLKDDAGITYGAHQATHKSGTLYKIVKMYCDMSSSATSKKLEPYVAGFKNPSLRHKYASNKALKALLVKAGEEPAMRFAQDKVFEVNYLEPAIQAVLGSGWVHPLSLAVVYDSMIQGGWTKVRDRITSKKTEKEWIKAYVAARRKWLSSSSRKVVRNSVYRMKTFETLIANGNWNLDTPFIVHGVRVTDNHLAVWIAADNPNQQVSESGDLDSIDVEQPSPNFFAGNTEGIAEEEIGEAGGSWEVDDEIVDVSAPGHLDDDTDTTEVPPVDTPEEEATVPDNGQTGDPAKAGEPVPDAPAQEGEAIVGGRPQDSPIIVDKVPEDKLSGWKTWPTTVAATLGSLGLSAGGVITSITGLELSPQTQVVVGWTVIVGLVVAAAFGLFYLISRAVATASEKRRVHEINMLELKLRADPTTYNVKLDRRGDTSNLTKSGLPLTFAEKDRRQQ